MLRLSAFGDLSLVGANQVDDIGSGVTPTAYQPLSNGGALDLFGDRQMAPGAVERVHAMRLRVAVETVDDYYRLLALRGKRDRLYRQMPDGSIHWIYARLAEVSARRHYEQAQYKLIQDVSLRFVAEGAIWNGALREITVSSPISPQGIEIAMPGSAPVTALLIEMTAGSASTGITLAREGGESLTYAGSLAEDAILVIDTGAMQVSAGSEIAPFNSLQLTPGAGQSNWFSLVPGSNPLTLTTATGVIDQIKITFYDAWC